jgi:hypothetical protein
VFPQINAFVCPDVEALSTAAMCGQKEVSLIVECTGLASGV